MTDKEFKLHAEECRRMLDNPQPPDDPDENAEWHEWHLFADGEWSIVRRRNPNYKPPTDERRNQDPF